MKRKFYINALLLNFFFLIFQHYHDADSPIRVLHGGKPKASPPSHAPPHLAADSSNSEQTPRKPNHSKPTEFGSASDAAELTPRAKDGEIYWNDDYISVKANSLMSGQLLSSNGVQLRSRSPLMRSRADRSASSSPKFRSGINGSL